MRRDDEPPQKMAVLWRRHESYTRMGGRHASERGRTVRSLIEPVQRLNEVADIYVDIFREIE